MNDRVDILLVDDEERFVDGLKAILDHYDYRCAKALTGSDAIDLLKRHEYDVALLDVGLPDMSGCDIARYISDSCDHTVSIMLTGLNNVETAVAAMKQGAYDFLAKPINHDVLLRTIDKALEHNRLRHDLKLSEERFKVLAEAAWEAIAIADGDRCLAANSRFHDLFGYTREDLAGRPLLAAVFAPESLPIAAGHAGGEAAGSIELVGLRKDGARFPVEVKWRRMDYLGTRADVWVIRDITERVRSEQERLTLQEQLAKANKLEALGLMAGSVAHDLNNILTAVVSYPDLLLSQMEASDRYYDEIRKIQEAGKRAAAVVADLVAIARGGRRKASLADLNTIVRAHLDSLEHRQRLAALPEVELTVDLAADPAAIVCSPQQIHKMLLNLIGNALEAVQPRGAIRIATANCRFANPIKRVESDRVGDYVQLTVADDGPGIAGDSLEKIFDPFYSTKKDGASGTGLGLSIVWNCVIAHDGWVEVANGEPGAVFTVYLPAHAEKQSSLVTVERPAAPIGGSETILLVDDEAEQNETMSRLLSSIGYKTFAAGSGTEALAFLHSCRVDLVVLDLLIGDEHGCRLFESILRLNPDQRAIMISGYARADDVTRAKALGITHVLQKPVTLAAVDEAIRESLGR